MVRGIYWERLPGEKLPDDAFDPPAGEDILDDMKGYVAKKERETVEKKKEDRSFYDPKTGLLNCDGVPSLTGDVDIDDMLRSCIRTLASKGQDYTVGTGDRLHNFRTVGEFVGVDQKVTLAVYLYKHVSAVFNYIKSGKKSESEPIEGRVMDCINYLLLFAKMVAEEKRREENEKFPTLGTCDVFCKRCGNPVRMSADQDPRMLCSCSRETK